MNPANNTLKFFTPQFLSELEFSSKKSTFYKYTLDKIIAVGSDIFFIGEQYKEQYVASENYGSSNSMQSTRYWQYDYMDIIVGKLNKEGTFEWIKNAPLRTSFRSYMSGTLNQYIMHPTGKDLYVFHNDHPKNLKLYDQGSFASADLKPVKEIKGSSFIYSKISLTDGTIKNDLVFDNTEHCFVISKPIESRIWPASNRNTFVPVASDEIIIYTTDKNSDKFVKLKLQ